MVIVNTNEDLRIKLQAESLTVVFGIDGFTRDKKWYYGDWPMTDLCIEYRYNTIFNEYGEPLMHYEIDIMRNALKRFLEGNPTKKHVFIGNEQNIQLIIDPDAYSEEPDSARRYIAQDIGMFMRINLNGNDEKGLYNTHNHLDIALSRSNIEKLYLYLGVVTNVIPIDDERVQKMLNDGTVFSQKNEDN